MRTIISVILVFIVAVAADGVVLPTFLGLHGGMLAFAFLAALPAVYGVRNDVIILGIICAFALEMWRGSSPGTAILAWLAAVAVWQLLVGFFSIGPVIEENRLGPGNLGSAVALGYILISVMSVMFIFIEKYFYQTEVDWLTLSSIVSSLRIWLVTGVGVIVFVYLLRLPEKIFNGARV